MRDVLGFVGFQVKSWVPDKAIFTYLKGIFFYRVPPHPAPLFIWGGGVETGLSPLAFLKFIHYVD